MLHIAVSSFDYQFNFCQMKTRTGETNHCGGFPVFLSSLIFDQPNIISMLKPAREKIQPSQWINNSNNISFSFFTELEISNIKRINQPMQSICTIKYFLLLIKIGIEKSMILMVFVVIYVDRHHFCTILCAKRMYK